jgi:transposase
MKKKKRLINKVKHLLKRANVPRWLHHFGPKTYEFWQHAIALLVKQECRLGYRRVSNLLNMLGVTVPTYSALAKMCKKIPLALWQLLLKATASNKLNLVAIDGTGMSRPLPSPYYYRRIDKPYPVEIPLKLSIAVSTKTKKVLSLRLRAKSAHDIKDSKYLIKHLPSKPKKLLADKGYDAEWLHRFCESLKIKAVIPMRDYGKKTIYRGKSLRRRCKKTFNKRVYHRREIVEAVIGAMKKKFGPSISSVKISAQRAEMYCRALAHNIISSLRGLFQRSRWEMAQKNNIYKTLILH